MSNRELATRIVNNFIKQHPRLSISDVLYRDLNTAFLWSATSEGAAFWARLYGSDTFCCATEFSKFLKKYYFSKKITNNFIDLSIYTLYETK